MGNEIRIEIVGTEGITPAIVDEEWMEKILEVPRNKGEISEVEWTGEIGIALLVAFAIPAASHFAEMAVKALYRLL